MTHGSAASTLINGLVSTSCAAVAKMLKQFPFVATSVWTPRIAVLILGSEMPHDPKSGYIHAQSQDLSTTQSQDPSIT